MTYKCIYFARQTFLGHDQVDKIVNDDRWTITREGAVYLLERDGVTWEVPASNVISAQRRSEKPAAKPKI